jgi:hypothetical protein
MARAVSAIDMTRSGQGNCSSREITFRKYSTLASSPVKKKVPVDIKKGA